MESMDDKKAEGSAAESKEKAKTSTADTVGAAIPLTFPASHQDPTPHLAPLRDNHSTYQAVAKICLQLNQYALNGSSSGLDDVNSGVAYSAIFHDASMAAALSDSFAALTECMQTHDDRRAKILCGKTLAIVARGTYAKLRHSPQLFAIRDTTNSRLEDEVGTDIPMALCTAALEDPDDGVAASVLQSLGVMCLSTDTTPGTLVEDELSREIACFIHHRISPHAPSLTAIEDEDSHIPQMELQTRILENVIAPRLMQLICRVMAFNDQSLYLAMILPIITASLVHMSKTAVTLYGMDRETYAKRWVEADYVTLIKDVVEAILIPALQASSGSNGHLALAAAMSSIRLIHACPHAPWVDDLCFWTLLVLKEEITTASVEGITTSLEAHLTVLSSMLICARAVPLPERSSILSLCLDKIRDLPSTTMAPRGIYSPALLLEANGGLSHYRRPARVALLAEIALSLFMDGPVDSSNDAENPRSSALESFLRSNEFTDAATDVEDGKVTQMREELALAFCMVAIGVGRRHKDSPANASESGSLHDQQRPYVVSVPKDEFLEWLRMSIMVLNTFNLCITWGAGAGYLSDEGSLAVAVQVNYVRLAQEVAHATALLSPMSVSLRMAPASAPPNLVWDAMEEAAAFLGQHDSNPMDNQVIVDSVGKAVDACVKKELKGTGVTNHFLRMYLLTLASDIWVQARYDATRKHLEGKGSNGSGQLNMNPASANDLLQALSPRRIFTKVVENHKSQIENYGKKKKETYKKYAQEMVTVCVTCIENIALAVNDWRKRFQNNAEAKELFDLAIASLEGKSPGNTDSDSSAEILPVCQAAVERIQAAFASNDQPAAEHQSLSSLLLEWPDLKRRPIVTSSRSPSGQSTFQEGYLTHLSRQLIAARIDQCVWSTPSVSTFPAAARKRNWLRLALPPLPAARDPQVPVTSLPKFSWGSSVSATSGGSDAAAVTLAYSVRKTMRYDGENEFHLVVVMRVHNITAVEVPGGIRLNLGVGQESASTSLDGHDPVSLDILKSLAEGDEDFTSTSILSSGMAVYKPELQSGDHITWEVIFRALPMSGPITLNPSVVFREMEDEPAHSSWAGTDGKEGDRDDTSAVSGVSQQSVNSKSDSSSGENKEGNEQKLNVTVPGEPLKLSPMVKLQPCPLVFFRDRCGDMDAFRFLWAKLPFQVIPLKVEGVPNEDETVDVSSDTLRLAAISTLKFPGNAIPGGFVSKLWAFMSLGGKRVLMVMAESEGDSKKKASPEKSIHVRSDDKQLLCCLAGTMSARQALVAALVPGLRAR